MEPVTGDLSKDQTSITRWMHPAALISSTENSSREGGKLQPAAGQNQEAFCGSWSMRLVLALLPAQVQLYATSTQATF